LAGVIKRRFDVFVFDANRRAAFLVRPDVWVHRPHPLGPFFPNMAIKGCVFAINVNNVLAGVFEAEMANFPLFAREGAITKWLRRHVARADLQQTGQKAINEFARQNSGDRMRKEDFITALLEAHPAASTRQVAKAWEQLAPKEWKEPGRKKSRTRPLA
jgi:hypothetical protein